MARTHTHNTQEPYLDLLRQMKFQNLAKEESDSTYTCGGLDEGKYRIGGAEVLVGESEGEMKELRDCRKKTLLKKDLELLNGKLRGVGCVCGVYACFRFVCVCVYIRVYMYVCISMCVCMCV